jgi:nucleoside-diphosphate-sugar epimerase
MTRVLVHGAGGFVGGAIMRALARAPGLTPVGCVRRRPANDAGLDWRLCDATDPRAMTDAAGTADFAVGAVLGNPSTMLAATRNLCRAARAAGHRRIVHISTMSVYGDAEGVVSEDAALDVTLDSAHLGPYAAAKIACEAIIRDFIAGGGEAVILRPGIVYGPGGQQWVGRIGRLLAARRLGDLGVLGDGFCNLVYHDDVGQAVVAALSSPTAAGCAINLAATAPPTWNEWFVRLACAIGATPVRRITGRRLRIEQRLLAPPLQVAKLIAAKLMAGPRGWPPGALPEPMPPSLLKLWGQRILLDPGRALDSGLERAATWFREQAA